METSEKIENIKDENIEKKDKKASSGKTKKWIIVVLVFILAITAGYLAWEEFNNNENMLTMKLEKYEAAVQNQYRGNYESALEVFIYLGDFKDSAERVFIIIERLNTIKYNEAIKFLEESNLDAAILLFEELGEFLDSRNLLVQAQADRRRMFIENASSSIFNIEKYSQLAIALSIVIRQEWSNSIVNDRDVMNYLTGVFIEREDLLHSLVDGQAVINNSVESIVNFNIENVLKEGNFGEIFDYIKQMEDIFNLIYAELIQRENIAMLDYNIFINRLDASENALNRLLNKVISMDSSIRNQVENLRNQELTQRLLRVDLFITQGSDGGGE